MAMPLAPTSMTERNAGLRADGACADGCRDRGKRADSIGDIIGAVGEAEEAAEQINGIVNSVLILSFVFSSDVTPRPSVFASEGIGTAGNYADNDGGDQADLPDFSQPLEDR